VLQGLGRQDNIVVEEEQKRAATLFGAGVARRCRTGVGLPHVPCREGIAFPIHVAQILD
jgi:hypothetical protein